MPMPTLRWIHFPQLASVGRSATASIPSRLADGLKRYSGACSTRAVKNTAATVQRDTVERRWPVGKAWSIQTTTANMLVLRITPTADRIGTVVLARAPPNAVAAPMLMMAPVRLLGRHHQARRPAVRYTSPIVGTRLNNHTGPPPASMKRAISMPAMAAPPTARPTRARFRERPTAERRPSRRFTAPA